jgi:hypothetical protein
LRLFFCVFDVKVRISYHTKVLVAINEVKQHKKGEAKLQGNLKIS